MERSCFSADALLLMQRAGEEAGKMGSVRIGSEHLLLALLTGPDTTGSRLLRELGWESSLWRNVLLSYTGKRREQRPPARSVSPHARRILSLAG
ncbi:MAG: Clp protease N-terminal domain-containing protein, partial [Oscillospiraceae bacterium]|nr:Clp protease N-terminal domain-containing protein [Oscillospiraceae bacterium]